MLGLLDPHRVRTNVQLFVDFAEPEAGRQKDLRLRYFACLNKLQRRSFRIPKGYNGPSLDFDILDPVNLPTVQHFLKKNIVAQEDSFSENEQAVIREKSRTAFELLQRYDAGVFEAISLLVARLLCAKKSGLGGGSFGDSLGVVWFDPDPSWESVDYAETLLHEATHQSVFVSDMVRRLFVLEPRELTHENALVTSAILQAPRPYDLAFHSACVAAALVDFYEKTEMPERSRKFAEPLKLTVAQLRSKGDFLTRPGLVILRQLERCVHAIT